MNPEKIKINIKNVGIILKPHVVSEFTNVLPNLIRWLRKRKISISFADFEQERIQKILKSSPEHIQFQSLKELHRNMDLNITLGGDGTLLGFGRLSDRNSAPIFGVNMGTLGFITEYAKSEFFDGLSTLLTSRCEIIRIPLYRVQVYKNKEKNKEKSRNKNRTKVIDTHFLNDVVISKHDISRMFNLTVENEEENIFNILGDGLIVSSPTGSTAYSLAAGGPIIGPNVHALALTPICPHGLTHRPIVISDRRPLFVKVPPHSDSIMITVDGQEVKELPPRQIIAISKSKSRHLKLIRNPQKTYFDTLKTKFTRDRRIF